MASAPKRRRVRDALRRRAENSHGIGAEPVDAVYDWVRGGGTVATLADTLAAELGESVSVSWLKFVISRLAPDATESLETHALGIANPAALRRANASNVTRTS
jgi:hypothetical protein